MEFSKTYNREEFLNFLRRDFLPDDFSQVNEPVVFATKTTYSKQATKLGICKSLDLVVYEIKHSGKDDPRVGLSKEAFRMLSEEWQSRALVLFVPETNANNYRFSLIEIKLEGDQTSAKVHRKYSNPRRYSYLLGEGVGINTPLDYLARVDRNRVPTKVSDEKDLTNRFSVEVLTKAFYNELSDWYAWAIDSVEFPGEQLMDTEEGRTEHRSKNVIRLLTRLLFVWFLKQKNLIPWQLFDGDYLNANLLKDFAPNLKIGLFKEKSQESRYYRAILQNLFFATLNCPITPQSKEDIRERGFRKSDWYGQGFGEDHLMRYESEFTNAKHFLELVNERVPFLNGGLFDCLDDKQNKTYIDGFSDNLPKPNRLKVPDFLFFGESQGKGQDISTFYGDKKKKSTDILGLVDILKKYNFTIEENMPFDQEVSLDPELLGKVFENLLASYNPETKTTARKQTGSFYTPREIVQYMVDESLVAHLKRTVGEELEEEYRKLMRYTDEEVMLEDGKRLAIIQSLQNCKVLDPACGSGAFPVGVLQQMVHILSQLDEDNVEWEKLIREEADKELLSILDVKSKEEQTELFNDITKAFDRNCNQPDYARKLYLIEKCIYGVDIQSIAVQISKLRFFISLVVDQKPTSDRTDNFGIRPLPNLEAKFAAANTLIGLKKEKTLFDDREIDKLQNKLVQASHRIFGAKSNKMKNKYKARVEELQFQIAEKLEMLGVVGNEDARLMRDWKMFDQNVSSPFFDPEWMFGVSGGFDIVIGNPPYIKEYTDRSAFEGLRKSSYYQGKMDLWYFFACNGIDFLCTKGHLCLIATNQWIANDGASKLRKKLITDAQIIQLLDFGDFMIFESASIQTMILLLSKNSSKIEYQFDCRRLNGVKNLKSQALGLLDKSYSAATYLSPIINRDLLADNVFRFSNDDKEAVLDKILNKSNFKLNDNEVGQGIVGAPDKAFLTTNYNNFNEDEQRFLKPYYTNTDRFCTPKSKLSIFYLSNKTFPHTNLDEYPNIKLHFEENKDSLVAAKIKYKSPSKNYFYLHRERDEKFFRDGDKIVCATRTCNVAFTYTKDEYYGSRALNFIVSNRVNLKFLTALLNSQLCEFWLRNKGKLTGEMLQIDKGHLLNFPIFVKNDDMFDNLIDKILEAKKANPTADTTGLESQIDQMVYALYELTYEEVLTIDPKTPITQQQYEAIIKMSSTNNNCQLSICALSKENGENMRVF